MCPAKTIPSQLLALLAVSAASAQTFGVATPPPADERPADRVVRIFDELSPPLGSPLPDLVVFDADGNEVPLRSFRGHYTVLLFGCLT